MSKANLPSDLRLIFNGILKVVNSGAVIKRGEVETILKNSSLKKAAENAPSTLKKILPNDFQDVVQRASMIPVGIQQFVSTAPKYILPENFVKRTSATATPHGITKLVDDDEEVLVIREEDLEGLYIQSLGVELLQQNEDGKRYAETLKESGHKDPVPPINSTIDLKEVLSSHSIESLENKKPPPIKVKVADIPRSSPRANIKPLSKSKPTSQLGETSKQRKVPSTRISRLVSYGGLAAGLGIGALTEMTKRSLGLTNPNTNNSLLESSPFLTEANAERIVDTLCRVRGAALKIGQILSIQDNTMINPQLQKVFERVRHAADFMPDWQMEKMLVTELGVEWRSMLAEFDSKPFAAASIGQVHLGKTHDGRPIAIKIQYPGVGEGISSDIDNLIAVLNVWSIIPEGVFIDNVITVAKRELAWEVDYQREARCAKRFRKLFEPYPDYYVPDVIDEFTTRRIYATELIEGIAIDKCENLDQETRNHICYLMLNLFFRELFEFQFMQTDPNWANFLYNAETKQIGLLDFGSSREYNNSFVDNYMMILQGAADADRETILKFSRSIGFLSGYESKIMETAHTETVLLLGEALRMSDKPYDFGSQDLTRRITQLVPVMVKERLIPPPEQIYSLHRKLSGIFLLCNRLRGQVQCRPIFERVRSSYKFNRPDTESQFEM